MPRNAMSYRSKMPFEKKNLKTYIILRRHCRSHPNLNKFHESCEAISLTGNNGFVLFSCYEVVIMDILQIFDSVMHVDPYTCFVTNRSGYYNKVCLMDFFLYNS